MNKKGKNKKGNKPPNLPVVVAEQTEKDVPEKEVVESAKEERVPEIVSEVAAVVGTEDVPKKPKRNKGKKKKDTDENICDAKDITTEEETKPAEEIIKPDALTEEVIAEKPGESTEIAPAVRKKKNKKKSNEPFESKLDEKENISKQDNTEPVFVVELKHDTLDEVTEEHETKQCKKKNKKKNRHNSDRSEKDDVPSCTMAFKNLTDSKELTDEKQVEECIKPSSKEDHVTQNEPPKVLEDTTQSKLTEEVLAAPPEFSSVTTNDDQAIAEVKKCENKNKKKNKKDRKGQQQPISCEIIPKTHTEVLTAQEERQKDERKEESLITETHDTNSKQKQKSITPSEITEMVDNSKAVIDEFISQVEKSEPSLIIKEEQKANVINPSSSPIMAEQNKQTEILSPAESTNIANNTMGKKRKKGPKTPKPTETDNQNQVLSKDSKEHDLIQLSPCIGAASSAEKPSVVIPLSASIKPEVTVETELLKSTENIPEPVTEIVDVGADNSKLDFKPVKKRKKSPKLPKKSDEVPENKELKTKPLPEEHTMRKDRDPIVSTESPKSDNVEIRSQKADESESSVCEISPEVLFPRASSQQLLDDNNNTVIREILTSEISLPDTPSSIDIPKTPEVTRKCKDNKVTGKEDVLSKTDLKSKMMEVNQDMEGLRRSIEKSLAEFTAMEKSEEKIEKDFENVSPQNLDITIPTETITVDSNIDSEKEKLAETGNKGFDSVDSKTEEKIQFHELIPSKEGNEASISRTSEPATTIIFKDENREIIAPPTNITTEETETPHVAQEQTVSQPTADSPPPLYPARKDNKNKHKKKKGKQDSAQASTSVATASSTNTSTNDGKDKETKITEESKDKTDKSSDTQEKGKQQATNEVNEDITEMDYEPIDNFEDALTSSVDDVNQTFDMIVTETNEQNNPKINIVEPDEEKQNPVKPPKNLLGHPDIPARSNKRDYKKEKDKRPNETQAKVKLKDGEDIEKQSKNTQTVKKMIKDVSPKVDNEEFVYKYNFRKVFLQSSCHVCKKELSKCRVPCGYCSLLFYCSNKHKDEDWPQHQALCFAVSTLVHLKDQKHIYADTKSVTGQDYRLVRMQMIVSCEKVLKRRLVPWEQEALLYPRMCANVDCREWRQGKLKDCEGCSQISYCTDHPEHLPKSHQRWCKSYSLYQKLVSYQQTKGRLEPKLPTKVMQNQYQIAEKINEVLAVMYEEKIDMNDIQYAALTQVATAPLTAVYCHQIYRNKVSTASNGVAKKTSFTIHVVGAELQFEADALNKWEVFFLHLRPELRELRVVLINYNLNPSELPLQLLGKIKLCENCLQNKRRVLFSFQDKKTYVEYRTSEDFIYPDLVCAYNPSIQRSSIYNDKDPWPAALKVILKLKVPFLITAYTMTELQKDALRVKECSEAPFNVVSDARCNSFASVRPDRNFISDDEMPLLFKNNCVLVVSG